jgi:hypothetical protein
MCSDCPYSITTLETASVSLADCTICPAPTKAPCPPSFFPVDCTEQGADFAPKVQRPAGD